MSDPLLVVEGLNAYYGPSHVLQNVSFSVTEQAVAIIGRNGMGKSTLCAAIMGMTPPRTSGSVRLEGTELIGRASYKIAGLGIGFVPQGRRLFPSLSVDEHLRMVRSRNGGRWTPDRIYELFPRLGERRRNGGAQLSGGEQQMLAIGRALLTNPTLLIMDEPAGIEPDVPRTEVVADVAALAEAGDRGAAVAAMGRGAAEVVKRLHEEGRLDGILALGGSGGSSIAATAMRELPVGVPKLI